MADIIGTNAATPTASEPVAPAPSRASVRSELQREVERVILPWVHKNVYADPKATAASARLHKLHGLKDLAKQDTKSAAVKQLYKEIDEDVTDTERDRAADKKAWQEGDRSVFEDLVDVETFYREYLLGPGGKSGPGLPAKLDVIVSHVVSTY